MPLYMEWDRRRSFSYPSILRGARTVMSEHDAFDRVLAAVHDATLDETRWPATSALIDEACGLTGNGLMVAEGPTNDVRALFVGLYARGQRRDDLEREYLTTYHPLDERVPRFRQLPARRLVHITDLYTAEELKTSRTYNELLPRAGMQDSLNVQLPGLAGSHIGWGLNDPVDAEGWGSSRITMVERLLPHIQQFVRVRQVLAGAGALGASLADLLATTGLGIIQLDGRGRIAAANDRALALLRTGEGLVDKGGALGADVPADDAVLQGLLTRALPPFGGPGAGGSMTVRRAADPLPLVVHLLPLGRPEPAACTWPVAAVVAVVDPARRPRLDPALVAAGLGLTPMESRVAVLLTEGKSLREVAAETGRQQTTIRWHLRQIFTKRGIARQAELVRLVLSLGGAAPGRR